MTDKYKVMHTYIYTTSTQPSKQNPEWLVSTLEQSTKTGTLKNMEDDKGGVNCLFPPTVSSTSNNNWGKLA